MDGILIVTGKSPQDRLLDLFVFCALFQFLHFELYLEREKRERIPNHEDRGSPKINGIDFPHLVFEINRISDAAQRAIPASNFNRAS